MNKKVAIIAFSLLGLYKSNAQTLTEITNKRLYEHHSSSINNNSEFGEEANGFQSGYDFVNQKYFYSFNKYSFGPYLNGEEANIDMVEHNGPFGNGENFGFTSGVSSIWDGDILGNKSTLWMRAPIGFNYYTTTSVSQLKTAFEFGNPSLSINSVDTFVYIGKIRGGNMFVALKCYNINNTTQTKGKHDVYFDFDYKYGSSTLGINEFKATSQVKIYPNPASNILNIELNQKALLQGFTIVNILGNKMDCKQINDEKSYDISALSSGVYFIVSNENNQIIGKFIK